jgi:formamidopyrimidine-DNA glycosylase
MMTGRISTIERVIDLETTKTGRGYPPPHTHLIIKSHNGHEFSWSDPRRFGQVIFSDSEAPFDALAIDALNLKITTTKDGSGGVLKDCNLTNQSVSKLTNNPKPIKSLILNQNYAFSGVGNWIADEVLYQTKIHPNQKHLTPDEARGVVGKVSEICRTACECNANVIVASISKPGDSPQSSPPPLPRIPSPYPGSSITGGLRRRRPLKITRVDP